jgi:hypothetical protein
MALRADLEVDRCGPPCRRASTCAKVNEADLRFAAIAANHPARQTG